jgi:hypothetical protein
MQYAADLADPLLDVRDVVESYRSHRVISPDWNETLRHAVDALSQLPPEAEVNTLMPGLLSDLHLLLTHGLDSSQQTVDRVARQVAHVLAEARISGIPTPEDADWSFGETNAS